MTLKKVPHMLANHWTNFVGRLRGEGSIHQTAQTAMVLAVQRTNRIPPPLIKRISRLESTSLDVLKSLVDELGSLLDLLGIIPTQDRFDPLGCNCRAMVLPQLSKNRVRISPIDILIEWNDGKVGRHGDDPVRY
jgi:hypothetical protein